MRWWTTRQLRKGTSKARIKALSNYLDESYIPLIVDYCLSRGTPPDVKRAAALALRRLLPESVLIVLRGLEQHRFRESEELIQALVESGSPEVSDYLIKRIGSEATRSGHSYDHLLMCRFIASLIRLEDPRLLPVLKEILNRPTTDNRPKLAAITGLESLGDLAATPELAKALHDADLREPARKALQKLGWEATGAGRVKLTERDETELLLATGVAAIRDVYNHRSSRSAETSGTAMTQLGSRLLQRVLPEMLIREEYEEKFRIFLAEAIGTPPLASYFYNSVDRFFLLLNNELVPTVVRGYLAVSLGNIGNPVAADGLKVFLLNTKDKTKTQWLASRALEGLVSLNQPPDVTLLNTVMEILGRRDYVDELLAPHHRGLAGRTLLWLASSEIRDPKLIRRHMRHLFMASFPSLTSSVLAFFEKMDTAWPTSEETADLIPELVEKLQSDDWHERKAAVEILNLIGGERGISKAAALIPEAVAMVRHGRSTNRKMGLAILTMIGDTSAVMPMVEHLQTGFLHDEYDEEGLRGLTQATTSLLRKTRDALSDRDLRLVTSIHDLPATRGEYISDDDAWHSKIEWRRGGADFSEIRRVAQDELKRRGVDI